MIRLLHRLLRSPGPDRSTIPGSREGVTSSSNDWFTAGAWNTQESKALEDALTQNNLDLAFDIIVGASGIQDQGKYLVQLFEKALMQSEKFLYVSFDAMRFCGHKLHSEEKLKFLIQMVIEAHKYDTTRVDNHYADSSNNWLGELRQLCLSPDDVAALKLGIAHLPHIASTVNNIFK